MAQHLAQRELFALIGHGPAHAAEVVEQRLGQVTHAPVVQDAGRVLALAELALVGVAQQRQVAQHRRLPAEIFVEQQVLGRRVDPLLAAQHMRDAHQVVIDHVGEVVGRHAVGLQQHLHVDLRPLEVDLPAQHVLHLAHALARHLHAHHVGLAGLEPCGDRGLAEPQAMPVVARLLLGGGLLAAQCIQSLGGAEAAERVPVLQQVIGMLAVDLAALALAIRRVRPAHIRAFIPFEPEPAQRFEDRGLGLAGAAHLVGILDAQDELAAVLAREAEVEQGNVGGADMRVAGGRRGDAGANGHREENPDKARADRACASGRKRKPSIPLWVRIYPEMCGRMVDVGLKPDLQARPTFSRAS